MLVLIGLLGVWPCLVLGTHGPDGFSEVFTMPGASFKLELHGPGITSKDRAIIREAGTECPGRSDKADSNARKNSISVATYVYHAQGAYEPSPLVHSGPNVASANFPGWLTASWYPVQLRMAGSSRICYCAARAEEEAGSPMLNPNESPCDLDYAVYRLVGAAYAMGIKHSTSIGACMVLSDGTLQENCQLTIHADRGGLSAEDSADLVSGDPAQICGEAPAGTTLQPRHPTLAEIRQSQGIWGSPEKREFTEELIRRKSRENHGLLSCLVRFRPVSQGKEMPLLGLSKYLQVPQWKIGMPRLQS